MRNNQLDLDDVFITLSQAQHYDSLWNNFIELMSQLGADLISYHHITPLGSLDEHRVDVLSHGYPRAWLNYYRQNKLHKYDPIFNMSYKTLRPIKWSEMAKDDQLSAQQKKVIFELKEWMKGDGYSIPAFGPCGKTACFGLGNTATIAEWDSATLRCFEWICAQFHLSYSIMRLKEFPKELSLNDQDRDILQQWARGINIAAIAENLGEKPKIIQTIIYDIMEKMNVTDNQSLMVRAAHLGLVKPRSN